jgi:hypothetical protein
VVYFSGTPITMSTAVFAPRSVADVNRHVRSCCRRLPRSSRPPRIGAGAGARRLFRRSTSG